MLSLLVNLENYIKAISRPDGYALRRMVLFEYGWLAIVSVFSIEIVLPEYLWNMSSTRPLYFKIYYRNILINFF